MRLHDYWREQAREAIANENPEDAVVVLLAEAFSDGGNAPKVIHRAIEPVSSGMETGSEKEGGKSR